MKDLGIFTPTSDFRVGDVVRHIWHTRYATVAKVGRSYLHVQIHNMHMPTGKNESTVQWLPTSVQLIERPNTHTSEASR